MVFIIQFILLHHNKEKYKLNKKNNNRYSKAKPCRNRERV